MKPTSRFPLWRMTFAAILSICVATVAAEPVEIQLWPGDAPGSEGKPTTEAVRVTPDGEHVVSSIHHPSLTPYLPAPEKNTGAAVVVIPGGGHRELWMDHEGYTIAKWLSERGVASFVLKYRLARETNSTYTVDEHALGDTQRAIRLIRSRAKEWGVNPDRIGVMGFSAGGELAFLAGMHFDAGKTDATDPIDHVSCKPSFQALIYPGSTRRFEASSNSPPAFLACAYNDRPDISEGLANVYLMLKKASVPTELHIYSSGGHGFGLRERNQKPVGTWVARFHEWMGDNGFLRKP